jgi:hypothetical protein
MSYCQIFKPKVKEIDLVTYTSDFNLGNAWGILTDACYIYVVAEITNTLIRYDLDGNNPLYIHFYTENGIRINDVGPNGIVKNCTNRYLISDGVNKCSSTFIIFSSSDIFGYNRNVGDGVKAFRIYAGSIISPVPPYFRPFYKGGTITDKHIFAADLLNGKIDVFKDNGKVNSIELQNSIVKYGVVSPNYAAPNNIVYLDDVLYVMYTYKSSANALFDNGTGGFIDIHDKHGIFMKHFNNTDLDIKSPWSLIKTVYHKKNIIIVSNYGSGQINIYNEYGDRIGELYDKNGSLLIINEIRGLYENCCRIYFTSNNNNGLMGYLKICQIHI